MHRIWQVLLVVFAVLLVGGCTDADVLRLQHWRLGSPSGTETDVELPGRFDELVGDRPAVYHLRTEVALPPDFRDRALSLSIPAFTGKTQLLVNGGGAWRIDDGPVGYRSGGLQTWLIGREHTSGTVLELDLVIEHTWNQSAWFDGLPRLALDPRGAATSQLLHAFNVWTAALAIGTLLTVGLTSVLLFAWDRRNRDYLWLSLQAFGIVPFPLYDLGFAQFVVGRVDTAVVAFCCVASVSGGVLTAHSHYKLRPAWLVGPVVAAMGVACVAFNGPFDATAVLGKLTIVICTLAILYLLRLYIRLYRRDPPALNSATNFVGMAFLGLTMAPAGLHWTGIGDPLQGLRLLSVGLIAFSLCQFVALGRSHLLTRRLSEQRMQEIAVLNDELRRQIAERSKQLSEALAKLASGSAAPVDLSIGDTVDDRYRVCSLLGSGGMGVVYEVERLSDGRTFALKTLPQTRDAARMARFAHEALVASKLRHPNLVGVYDIGFANTGFMYLVLELAHGRPLNAFERPMPLRRALPVLRDVAAGLHALHEAGIVHRDLKPANIIIDEHASGALSARIVDFGISGMLGGIDPEADPEAEVVPLGDVGDTYDVGDPEDCLPDDGTLIVKKSRGSSASTLASRLTQHDELIGTPAFMAPELGVSGVRPTGAADMFAYGVIAFELLTGVMPFADVQVLRAVRGQSLEDAPSLAGRVEDLDPRLVELFDRCLKTSSEERPSPTELLAALEDARDEPRDRAMGEG